MGLSFTDDQLRSVSGEVMAIPALLLSLADQKAKAIQGKADTQAKDNGNHAFFDFFRSTIDLYHTEKKHKDGVAKTSYLFQTLDDGAAQRPGNLHYPTSPIWAQMKPKLIDSNNGLPTSPFSPYEIAQHPLITAKISELKTGFADGAVDTQLTTAYVMGQDIEVDDAGIAVGNRIVIDQGGVSLLATVLAVKPPSTTGAADLELNVLAPPSGALPLGARVRNFHPGFTNNEREGLSVPYAPEVLAYWSSELFSLAGIWETTLDGQMTPLNTIDAGGAENTQRDAEKNSITTAKSAIDTWQAAPATGAGVGRYGNTALAPLEAQVAARTAAAPARITEITTALGSVSQAPNGDFSGAGHYFSLFKWIDIRATKAGGTLFSFYNFDLIVVFIDAKIVTATNQKAEYDSKMVVKKLTEDPDGTAFIKVDDPAGLSISDAVKIVDDSATPILSTTIVGISGLTVELAASVSGFLVDQRARLVKLL